MSHRSSSFLLNRSSRICENLQEREARRNTEAFGRNLNNEITSRWMSNSVFLKYGSHSQAVIEIGI